MKLTAIFLASFLFAGFAFADDPGDPDSVYIGNLDGSPILVGLDEVISVPVWIKTDDAVSYAHLPVASDNLYIVERTTGEHVLNECIPNTPPGFPTPDYLWFMPPDNMGPQRTNQSLVAFWLYGAFFDTHYDWCYKFNFFMKTTSDPNVIGDTAFCFSEGYNSIHGPLLFGLSDGITEVIPQIIYGSLYFAVSGINENNNMPYKFEIFGVYPNPFNAATTIEFTLPEESIIEISVYNILGRKMAELFKGRKAAGNHAVTWDATVAPSGVYFALLECGSRSSAVKMLLLK